MTIWQRIREALQPLEVPMAQSRYIPEVPGELPNLFITYTLVSSPVVQEADDKATERRYRMQISIYSRTGMSAMPNVNGAMTAAGFIEGPWRELPYDEKTRHYGLVKDYFFLEE